MRRLSFFSILLLSLLRLQAAPGSTFDFLIKNTDIYPGTERSISVWVPDEYQVDKPACLIIRFDRLSNLPDCAAPLIREGKIPVCIAIGIEPGKVYDQSHKSVIRYNRSNEFDRTDGTMARFLEIEVIPALERQRTPDGRAIRISRNPSDRALVGASSGAIAAFTAAWERPDLFSRVYSMIGTYVPFRYGDQYPGLIRKTEPKRLRVFFQDNKYDTWNPIFGSWYEYNRQMFDAMRFAGYETACQWDEGKHSGDNGNAILARVLEWLWAGWPEEVGRGVSSNGTLQAILDPEQDWELVRRNVPSGLILVPDDMYGVRADKKKKGYNPMEAVYPGGGLCAIAREGSTWITQYVISNGRRLYGQEYWCLHSPAKQIVFDENGYLYCATEKGIQICDHNGRVRAILAPPGGPVVSVAFSGDTLWAISGGCTWKRKLRVRGATPDSPTPKREGQG